MHRKKLVEGHLVKRSSKMAINAILTQFSDFVDT